MAWKAPETRARSGSGTTAAKIVPMLMSRIITPNPETNSAVNSIPRITGRGPAASGTSSTGTGYTMQPMR
jgi:hypothetical protein